MIGHSLENVPVTLIPVVFYVWSEGVLSKKCKLHYPHPISGNLPLWVCIRLIKLDVCLSVTTVKFVFLSSFLNIVSVEIQLGFLFSLNYSRKSCLLDFCSLNGCLRFRPLFSCRGSVSWSLIIILFVCACTELTRLHTHAETRCYCCK